MADELPPSLREALDRLLDFRDEHGYFPSVRELADRLGMSVGAAHDRLQQLERAGVLRRVRSQPRAICLLEGARA